MKRITRGLLASAVVLFSLFVFAGCGDDDGRTVFTAVILSDQPSDGDIAFEAPATYIVTQGPDTLFFGFDASGLREYRAFLDFPLDGSTGQPAIPLNATIQSATLTVRIVSMQFETAVPTLLDLVTYTPRNLVPLDWDSDPLATRSPFDIYSSDVGSDVVIEVTSLMQEAQALGLSDFQVRFLLDFVPNADGFVGIDDQPTVAATAPILTVQYY